MAKPGMLFSIGALLPLLAIGGPAVAQVEQQPNIIVILTDDQGYADLGSQQAVNDVRTPHLDRLAAEGVRCTAGYVTAPQCTPSRAGLLTGRHQQRFGIDTIPDGPLPLAEVTIAERLRAVGYRTGMIGKWHLEPNPQCRRWAEQHLPAASLRPRGPIDIPPDIAREYFPGAQGFDEYFCGARHGYWANFDLARQTLAPAGQAIRDDRFRVDVQSDAAVTFIERNAASPFFLYVAYYAPHVPLEATAAYLERHAEVKINRRRHALAMLSAIDDGVGRILQTLAARKIDDNTLIIFTSDNGAPLKLTKDDLPIAQEGGFWNGSLNDPLVGEKGMLAEGGIRVPFLLRWPAQLPRGATFHEPVSTLDIAATAVASSGAAADTALDGVNLIPFLRGERNAAPHEALYWRFWGQAAIRAGSWKYLTLSNGQEYLFDLASPESERKNLLPGNRDQADQLRAHLLQWTAQMQPAGLPAAPLNKQELGWYGHYFGLRLQ